MEFRLKVWKERKKELKLTLEDIAKETGASLSTIKDIFRGANKNPSYAIVEAIESVLLLDANRIKMLFWKEKERNNNLELAYERNMKIELYDANILANMTQDEKDIFYMLPKLEKDEIDELANYLEYIIFKRQ